MSTNKIQKKELPSVEFRITSIKISWLSYIYRDNKKPRTSWTQRSLCMQMDNCPDMWKLEIRNHTYSHESGTYTLHQWCVGPQRIYVHKCVFSRPLMKLNPCNFALCLSPYNPGALHSGLVECKQFFWKWFFHLREIKGEPKDSSNVKLCALVLVNFPYMWLLRSTPPLNQDTPWNVSGQTYQNGVCCFNPQIVVALHQKNF